MRLLDLIAQSSPSQSGVPPTQPLPGPHHFAQAVHACPLRLVLADDLTRCSTALAYAEGDRLSGCLDLVLVPSERLWVEWAEWPRMEALSDILETQINPTVTGGRTGVLINSDASGRAGTIRSFWSTAFIIPMLFALFLLLAAKGGAQQRVVNMDRLNRMRRHSGKTELLEHVEVFASLRAQREGNRTHVDANTRIGRRLHHVRGHLARRGYSIFWRSPHLRGNARLGVVRSRTVELTFYCTV